MLSLKIWVSLVAQMLKRLPAICERPGFDPWIGKIPWRRQLTPVFLPRKSHGEKEPRRLPYTGIKELDTTEQLHSTAKELYVSLNHTLFFFF